MEEWKAKKDSPSWYWKIHSVNNVITLLLYLIIANEGRLNSNSSVISVLARLLQPFRGELYYGQIMRVWLHHFHN